MKILLPAAFVFISFSCHKTNGDTNPVPNTPDPDYTVIPAAENVNTEIIGYITNDQNQVIGGPGLTNLHLNNITYTADNNGRIHTGTISTDKYNTKLMAEPGGGWDYYFTNKSLPVTSSIKNYVRIKVLNRIAIGNVRNDAGGTYSIPNGGSITFGANTFFQTPTLIYPGYFAPDIYADIVSAYFDPESSDFALRLPAYLAGDDDQNRWFLKSYGVVTMAMYTSSMTLNNVDFYNGGTADLKLNIPAGMLAGAPDSITTWQLNNGAWTKGGIAKKINNSYETKINKATAWNFAAPVKGVYLTINVRTDSGASITNTTVRIRSDNHVIAESQTDADGNAVCFVPSGEPLVAEVLPGDISFSSTTYRFSIGSINKVSSVSVKLPVTAPELTSVSSNVLNCNGDPVTNGIAKIFCWPNQEYFAPVKNGRFSTSMWLYGSHSSATVQVTDYSTNTQGDSIYMILFTGNEQEINSYSCRNTPLLYCNYAIDNTEYELKDNANSSTVYLSASRAGPAALAIKTTTGNKGIDFDAWPLDVGVWGGVMNNVVINGVPCQVDATKDGMLSYTRFDAAINGYLEGYFSFYYKDNLNVSHHASGNFKVKRTF